jgi:hypothetical protein
MNYRKATVLSEEAANTAAVKTVDLEGFDVISRLIVRLNVINASHAATDHPAKILKKVEIVDGSDVLYSLSGQELEAMDFYDTLRPRDYELDYMGFWPCQMNFKMLMGRWLFDPNLAFDPSKFTNPQLKITHDKALGGSLPGSMNLQVLADVFDEKRVAPLGWLRSTEFYTYTPVASSYKEVDLPDDYILKRMLIQSQYPTNSFTDNIDELRLDEDQLKKIPIDLNMFHYLGMTENVYPMYEENVHFSGAELGSYLYVTPGEYPSIAWGQSGAPTAYHTADQGGGKLTVASLGSSEYRALVKGYLPHCCLPVEFGDQWDMFDWYDITKIKKLRLRLHHASGIGGNVNIVLQQLRRY